MSSSHPGVRTGHEPGPGPPPTTSSPASSVEVPANASLERLERLCHTAALLGLLASDPDSGSADADEEREEGIRGAGRS